MDYDLITWDNSFSVGFAILDEQHKELVNMINELTEDCKKGTSAAELSFKLVLERAVEYAKTHFADEEKYMDKVLYPNMAAHKKEHFNFLFEVVNLVNEVESGNTTPIEFVNFLKKWVLNHVAKSDMKYAPYLRKL